MAAVHYVLDYEHMAAGYAGIHILGYAHYSGGPLAVAVAGYGHEVQLCHTSHMPHKVGKEVDGAPEYADAYHVLALVILRKLSAQLGYAPLQFLLAYQHLIHYLIKIGLFCHVEPPVIFKIFLFTAPQRTLHEAPASCFRPPSPYRKYRSPV